MRHKRSYIDYIKKLFVKYFISVILIISTLYVFSLYFAYQVIVVKENQKASMIWSKTMAEDLQAYQDELLSVAASKPVKDAIVIENSLLNAYDLLYKFRNNRILKGNFALVDKEGRMIATNLYEKNAEELQENMPLKVMQGIEEPKTIHRRLDYQLFQYDQESSYYFAAPVVDNEKVILGYLFYFIEEDPFEQFNQISDLIILTDSFENVIYASDYSLVDAYGKYISEKNKNKDITEIMDHHYYVTHKKLLDGKFNTYNLMSVSIFQQLAVSGIAYILGLIIIVNFMIYLVSPKIMEKSVEGFKRLLSFINNPDSKKEEQNFEEFQLVEEAFLKKMQRIEELNEINQNIQEVTRKLEIKQLEGQFNPHFAFNVLEMLRYEIAFDSKNADEIIVSFANLMRYNTYYDETEIALETDLKYVHDYLKLQKMRFNERLDYDIEVEEGLDHVPIPKMVIQPLIENSIKHNIEIIRRLQIDIKISQTEKYILLRVSDNGVGMQEEELLAIRKMLNGEDYSSNHYGLYYCQRIVQLLYGNEYGIKISSKKDKGTTITILLPNPTIDSKENHFQLKGGE